MAHNIRLPEVKQVNNVEDGNHSWVGVQRQAIVGLKPGTLQLYLYLMSVDSGGWRSQRSAARELGRSMDAVQRAMKDLEGLGLVVVDRTAPYAPLYVVDRDYVGAVESRDGVLKNGIPETSTDLTRGNDQGRTENQNGAYRKPAHGRTENQNGGVPETRTPRRDEPDIETVEAEVLPDGPIDAPNIPAPTDTPTKPEQPASDAQSGVIDLFGNQQPAEKPKKYRRPAPGEYTEDFNAFWSLVTRKQSKADAARLFEEAVEEVGAELVIDRARQYYHLKQLEGTETRYIKSGKNWLRDRLYEDDLTEDLQRAVLAHAQRKDSRFAGLVPSQAAVNDRLVEQYVGPMGPSSFAEIRQAEHNTQFGN